MSTIKELTERLEALPGRRKQAEQIALLAKFEGLVRASHLDLAATLGEQVNARVVFPDLDLKKFEGHRREVGKVAKRLATRLRATTEAIATEATENGVREIREGCSKAKTVLRGVWAERVSARSAELRPLLDVAREARLAGSEMTAALSQLEGQQVPPADLATATRLSASMTLMIKSVSALGLEGSIGAFLAAAVRGEGRAAELAVPEIRDFLDRHNLWPMLRVRLG